MNDVETIRRAFEQKYAAWGLRLPDQERGALLEQGWTIHFHYGDEGGQPCLEYFASHRMTNDTLNCIHADGHEELLGYCQEFYVADDKQAEQAYYAHNQAFYDMVKRLGLWEMEP